jgi:hypothetical protein
MLAVPSLECIDGAKLFASNCSPLLKKSLASVTRDAMMC